MLSLAMIGSLLNMKNAPRHLVAGAATDAWNVSSLPLIGYEPLLVERLPTWPNATPNLFHR